MRILERVEELRYPCAGLTFHRPTGWVGCGCINQSEAHTGNNPAYLVDRTDHVLFLKTLYPAALRSFKH